MGFSGVVKDALGDSGFAGINVGHDADVSYLGNRCFFTHGSCLLENLRDYIKGIGLDFSSPLFCRVMRFVYSKTGSSKYLI